MNIYSKKNIGEKNFSSISGLKIVEKNLGKDKSDWKFLAEASKQIEFTLKDLSRSLPENTDVFQSFMSSFSEMFSSIKTKDSWKKKIEKEAKRLSLSPEIVEEKLYNAYKAVLNLIILNLMDFSNGLISVEEALKINFGEIEVDLSSLEITDLEENIKSRIMEVYDNDCVKLSQIVEKKINELEVYKDNELGEKDIFEIDEEIGEYTKYISENTVSSFHDKFSKIYEILTKLIELNPNSDHLLKLKQVLEQALTETKSYENFKNTVLIRANDAKNSGYENTNFVEAQESLYCFYTALFRIFSRQLKSLKEEKIISKAIDFEKYFDTENHNSWLIKTAYTIEDNRKREVPKYVEEESLIDTEEGQVEEEATEDLKTDENNSGPSNNEVITTEHILRPLTIESDNKPAHPDIVDEASNLISGEDEKGKDTDEKKFTFEEKHQKMLSEFPEYTDDELGEKDIFNRNEKGILTKDIDQKIVEDFNKKYEDLLTLIKVLEKQFPENQNLKLLLAFIRGRIEETKSMENWTHTVKIRADGAKNMGLKHADFVSAQEGLYCFHLGALRTIVRQLRLLNNSKDFNEKDVNSCLNYQDFFNPDNKNSWLIKTARHVENNRKKDVPEDSGPPIGPGPRKIREKVKFVDVSEVVKAFAYREAERQLNDWLDQPEEGLFDRKTRFGSIMNMVTAPFRHPFKWMKKVWVRQMEPRYRQKFMKEVHDRIVNDQDLMAELETRILTTNSKISKPLHRSSTPFSERRNSEILDSIVSEFVDESEQNLEKGKNLNEPARLEMNNRIAQLLRNYLSNGWTRKQLQHEVRNMLNQAKADNVLNNSDFVNVASRERDAEGLMYANNLEKLFEGMRDQVDYQTANLSPEQKKLYAEHLISTMDLDISMGLKMADLHNKRPKGTFSWIDRFALKAQSLPILGRFISPLMLGAVTGLLTRWGLRKGAVVAGGAMTVGMGFASVGAMTMFAPLLAGATVGGAYAYFRRGHEIKHDRAFDMRREALGDDSKGFRTQRMRQYSFNPMEIDQALQIVNTRNINTDREKLKLAQPNNLQPLAEILARLLVEDQRNEIYYSRNNRSVKGIYTSDQIDNITVDLFKTNLKDGKDYKTSLVQKNAMKKVLFDYLESLGLIRKNRLGVQTLDVSATAPNIALLGIGNSGFEDLVKAEMEKLNSDIISKDKAFSKFVRKSKIKSAGIGGVTGIVGGMVGQKVFNVAALALFDSPSRIGTLDYVLGERPSAGTGPDYFVDGKPVPLDENGMVTVISKDNSALRLKINPDGSIDPKSLPNGWSLENGNLVKRESGSIFVDGISTPMTPDSINNINIRRAKFELFVDSSGNIDPNKSVLPSKWRVEGNELVFEDVIRTTQNLKNPADWANYHPDRQHPVSVRSFMVNEKGPSGYVGMDSTPEVFNANASGTELKMSYSIDKKSGDVIVSAKRMMGMIASNSSGSRNLPIDSKALENMIFTLSPDRGAFKPLVFEFNGNDSVRIPHNIAKDFFATNTDSNGEWIIEKNIPGRSGWKGVNGLHGLSYVDSVDSSTGKRNVLALAARWNTPPLEEVLEKPVYERFTITITPPSEEIISASMTQTPEILASPAIPTVVAPREQLEESEDDANNKNGPKKLAKKSNLDAVEAIEVSGENGPPPAPKNPPAPKVPSVKKDLKLKK